MSLIFIYLLHLYCKAQFKDKFKEKGVKVESSIEERFGITLRAALRTRFGRLPSAAFVANQFNLRARTSGSVSGESVRRWMRGISTPRFDHFEILVAWLNLNLYEIFNRELRPKTACDKPSFVTRFSVLRPELQEDLLNLAEASIGLCHLGIVSERMETRAS